MRGKLGGGRGGSGPINHPNQSSEVETKQRQIRNNQIKKKTPMQTPVKWEHNKKYGKIANKMDDHVL